MEMIEKCLVLRFAAVCIVFISSCDSVYHAHYIVDNQSNDSVIIEYEGYFQNGFIDTVKTIPGNTRDTLEFNFVIEDVKHFGDCCPCKFDSIKTSDSTLEIINPAKWEIEKRDMKNDDYVNCIFRK